MKSVVHYFCGIAFGSKSAVAAVMIMRTNEYLWYSSYISQVPLVSPAMETTVRQEASRTLGSVFIHHVRLLASLPPNFQNTKVHGRRIHT